MISRMTGKTVLVAALVILAAALAQAKEASLYPLGLKGYDPVAYFMLGQPRLGDERYQASWEEVRYHFSSPAHLEMFSQNPERFIPRFKGFCLMAMANNAKVAADPEAWIIRDDKLYVFFSKAVRDKFLRDPAGHLAKAKHNWAKQ